MAYALPHSSEALNTAESIQLRILGTFEDRYGPDLLEFDDALGIDQEFFRIAFKPEKWTLLHRFIYHYLWEEWNYFRRKSDNEFISDSCKLLHRYNVTFSVGRQHDITAFKDYLFDNMKGPLKKISHEAFCVLFNDKNLMRRFSERIAEATSDIEPTEHPSYLSGKGILKRSGSWPTWLREALFYRENGRCAECSKSLTGVFDSSLKPQIDHIVPISNGGTTDPTNLQILCAPCNKKKGNSSNLAGAFIYVPWEFSPN